VKIRRNRIGKREIRVRAGDREFRIRAVRRGSSDVWLARCDERLEKATGEGVQDVHWFPLKLEAVGREPSECLETAYRELVAILERQP
jgi:hypothetical protein